MTLQIELSRRKIAEVLHFTTNRGVVGVLSSKFLQSRFRLPMNDYLQYVLHVNAKDRPEAAEIFDKSNNWLDFVNLSISEINSRYFLVSQKWHKESEVWWAILSFDPSIAEHAGVIFTTTNNAYDQMCRRAPGLEGFNSLFAPEIPRKHGWTVSRRSRASHLATCEQAEVLYPGQIPTQCLKRIYVTCGEHHDLAVGWLREFGYSGVTVSIDPNKFLGVPN
jgi:hypothetical protein